MSRPIRLAGALIAPLIVLACSSHALAWGSTGHRFIGRLAMEALPTEVPAYLRTPVSAAKVGELAREPDRWKASGKTHDSDLDPGHFMDLDDNGKIAGGLALDSLPPTRAEYETALRAGGLDSWKAGYLPYSIIEGWQQLTKDFVYLRIDTAAAKSSKLAAHRAWFTADAAERRELILRDIGVLGHYVGDGSQPLHISEHYNGWGPFPNPNGYTQDKVHAPFEGVFIRSNVTAAMVRARMAPLHDCGCAIDRRTADYLDATGKQAEPFYQLWKAGGFVDGDARGRAFAAERLAAGADELRDLIVLAWRASVQGEAGWPAVKAADVEAGKVDPYDSLLGAD